MGAVRGDATGGARGAAAVVEKGGATGDDKCEVERQATDTRTCGVWQAEEAPRSPGLESLAAVSRPAGSRLSRTKKQGQLPRNFCTHERVDVRKMRRQIERCKRSFPRPVVDVTKLRVGFVVVSPDVRGDDNEPSDVVEISPVSTVGLPDPQPRLLDQSVCSGSTSVPLSTIEEVQEEGEDVDDGSDDSVDRVGHGRGCSAGSKYVPLTHGQWSKDDLEKMARLELALPSDVRSRVAAL
ncbi:hypothetical protein HPB48_002549 [Haemaphysalis longicornis]|uniref:Uncharacterized protein n=1 Tax=Haemaphysalis longicornis TaxID=44386 RepID=A0A9J6GN53_HAELO|nr:hypothetical protein HPB48_002549 [Haemaphysalis longicornis]